MRKTTMMTASIASGVLRAFSYSIRMQYKRARTETRDTNIYVCIFTCIYSICTITQAGRTTGNIHSRAESGRTHAQHRGVCCVRAAFCDLRPLDDRDQTRANCIYGSVFCCVLYDCIARRSTAGADMYTVLQTSHSMHSCVRNSHRFAVTLL